MALPKLDTPTYSMTLPSTGEEIKYRPFLVKEQKLMLVAQDTKDVKESYNNLKEIIDACTFNKIDIENSPIFDIEYMFLRVRSKSIGSKANVNVICPDDLETRQMVEIDLDEINVQIDENHTNKISISDDFTVIMKYPSLKDTTIIEQDNANSMIEMIVNCIVEIHHGETIYASADMNDKEKKEFLESFSIEQFTKLNDFFDTMPRIRHYVNVKNPKTEIESQVLIEGLESFLA
jgi:hypothetical protein